VAWGDYDNDGDLDILLTGADSSGNPVAKVYRNEECADLALAKAVAPASAAPGAAITYTLRFTNTGPGSARGVVIRDSIPVSVTVSRVTSSTVGSGVRITQTSAGPNFAWTVSDLAVGAGGVITLTGTLSNSVALGGTQITNTATITASNDITATNNSSSARVALFNLTSHSPVTHAVGVAVTANITAGFDANVNAATVTTRTFTVRSSFRGLFTDTRDRQRQRADPQPQPGLLCRRAGAGGGDGECAQHGRRAPAAHPVGLHRRAGQAALSGRLRRQRAGR
jgi:uncharacterized repeat protein (TIGR01451 family)